MDNLERDLSQKVVRWTEDGDHDGATWANAILEVLRGRRAQVGSLREQLAGAVEENERLRERVASLMLEEPAKTRGLYAAIDELQARLTERGGR